MAARGCHASPPHPFVLQPISRRATRWGRGPLPRVGPDRPWPLGPLLRRHRTAAPAPSLSHAPVLGCRQCRCPTHPPAGEPTQQISQTATHRGPIDPPAALPRERSELPPSLPPPLPPPGAVRRPAANPRVDLTPLASPAAPDGPVAWTGTVPAVACYVQPYSCTGLPLARARCQATARRLRICAPQPRRMPHLCFARRIPTHSPSARSLTGRAFAAQQNAPITAAV
jgi:hypothetical protein